MRVDFSIDCNSPLYVGFMRPYALVMVFIYPIGVPVYYALTLFRNKEELNALRRLELSISTEQSRAKLGRFLAGRALRDYMPEIDEAIEREQALQESYDAKCAKLPGALRKLTAGCKSLPTGPNKRTCWWTVSLVSPL